jgi:hypothetical protein
LFPPTKKKKKKPQKEGKKKGSEELVAHENFIKSFEKRREEKA